MSDCIHGLPQYEYCAECHGPPPTQDETPTAYPPPSLHPDVLAAIDRLQAEVRRLTGIDDAAPRAAEPGEG